MAEKVKRKFQGSIILLILMVLFCFPIAIIYFLMRREPVAQNYPAGQGYYPPQQPPQYPPQYPPEGPQF